MEIEGKVVDVYVLKRPHMDEFMASIAGYFEIIVFTASLSKYADPLLDLLDKPGVVRWRLLGALALELARGGRSEYTIISGSWNKYNS